jgi:hypothetical protein
MEALAETDALKSPHNVKFTDRTWRRVQHEAIDRGMTASDLVEEAVQAYLQRQASTESGDR